MTKITAALVFCLFFALAPGPAAAVDNGGSLVMGTIGDATSMIPMITSDSASHEMSGLVYNGLLKYDKDINLIGDLAKSWTVSPDGLTITFKIRQGVRWQDGKPYTAAGRPVQLALHGGPQDPHRLFRRLHEGNQGRGPG